MKTYSHLKNQRPNVFSRNSVRLLGSCPPKTIFPCGSITIMKGMLLTAYDSVAPFTLSLSAHSLSLIHI